MASKKIQKVYNLEQEDIDHSSGSNAGAWI